MKKIILYLGMAALFAFTSCQQDPVDDANALQLIPDEVEMIFAIHPNILLEKGDFNSFKEATFYQDFIEEVRKENQVIAKVFEDPEQSGIDLDQPILIAADYNTEVEDDNEVYIGFFMHLADPGKLEKNINSTDAEVIPVSQSYKYFNPSEEAIVGWDEEFAVALVGETDRISPEFVNEILKGDLPRIAANANVRKWINTDFDMGQWVRGTAISRDLDMDTEVIAKLLTDWEALKNSYLHNYIYFEDGTIEAKSNFFIDKQLTNDLDLLFKNRVRTDFASYFHTDQLLGYMTAAFSPKGINQFLIEKYSKGFANQGLQSLDVEVDDIVAALDGDIAFASYQGARKNEFKLLFGAKIDDRKAFDKLLESALKNEYLEKVSDDHYKMIELFSYRKGGTDSTQRSNISIGGDHLLIKDDIVFLSNELAFLEQIEQGTVNTDQDKLMKQMVDLSRDNIFAGALSAGNFNRPFFNEDAIEMVDEITINANRKEATAQFKFKKQEENSLKQLIQILQKSKEKEEKEF